MATNTHRSPRRRRADSLRGLLAVAAGLCLLVGALDSTNAACHPSGPSKLRSSAMRTRAAVANGRGTNHRGSYGWPVKPFFQQHPVRGFFGDPRIGDGGQRQFHFGVDVSAPNGTAVYATLSGRVWFIHEDAIGVRAGGGLAFEYWHIRPIVRSGQYVTAYRTVIGHIEKPWAHVHFSETRSGAYLNPLRPGAMGPFRDSTRPAVARVLRAGDGEIEADVLDETPIAVAAPWSDLPVMPALVRWRLAGRTCGRWTTAADFRWTIPSAGVFSTVYAPATRQNHAQRPGLYRVRLVRGVRLRRGLRIQILLADASGNTSLSTFRLGNGTGLLARLTRVA